MSLGRINETIVSSWWVAYVVAGLALGSTLVWMGAWTELALFVAVPAGLALLVIAATFVQMCMRRKRVRLPRQEEAVKFLWHDCLGRTDDPPTVYWVLGTTGFYAPMPFPRRVGGVTLSPWAVTCAMDDRLFSESTLAHELIHAHMLRIGIIDPRHKRSEWWGDDTGLVAKYNARLWSERGL